MVDNSAFGLPTELQLHITGADADANRLEVSMTKGTADVTLNGAWA